MRFKVYIKPFDDHGDYQTDWTEVTQDVTENNLSDIRQLLEDEEYNVGVFKFADFKIDLRNEHGMYSDVGDNKSIFFYKRTNSLVKVTWQEQEFESYAGMCFAGGTITENVEYELFQGLLNDEASDMDIQDQIVSFRVLGRESIFALVQVPFTSIANGDLASAIIKDLLNQTAITALMTYSASNIVVDNDLIIDDVGDWEDVTVKQALDDLLLITNSVLYISDGTVYVKSRTGQTVDFTFYGQASERGVENIVNITNIKTGINRTFNQWFWEDTALSAETPESTAKYGVRQKDISWTQITNNTRRQDVLDTLLAEFSLPKQELTLTCNITAETIVLDFLDKLTIDYPTVLYAADGHDMPVYGVAEYGEDFYPIGVWSLTIDTSQIWQIMGRIVKTKNRQIEFKLRRVA